VCHWSPKKPFWLEVCWLEHACGFSQHECTSNRPLGVQPQLVADFQSLSAAYNVSHQLRYLEECGALWWAGSSSYPHQPPL
jgi:hypothetical protein